MARIRIEPLQRPEEETLSASESGRVVGAGPYYSSYYQGYGGTVMPYGYGTFTVGGAFVPSVTAGIGGGIGLNNPMQSVASPFGIISGPTAYRLGY